MRYSKLSSINNSTYTKFLILLFIVICTINILHHEMWRDELQSLMIADNSSSLSELVKNTRYEFTPRLWYFFIYLIRNITKNILAIKLFNLLIAFATVYIFIRFSPFTKLQKLLFIFGYFPLYEYGTISRHYMLSLLLIFICCILFKPREKNYLLLSFILFLLSQVNLIGPIIAIALAAALILDFFLLSKGLKEKIVSSKGIEIIISFLIFIAGIIIALFPVLAVFQPAYMLGQNNNLKYFCEGVIGIYRSYIPIPEIKLSFWNTNVIQNIYVQLWASLLLVTLALIAFIKKPIPLILYVLGTSGIVTSLWKIYSVHFLRIEGYLFIILIVCFWLSSYYSGKNISLKLSKTIKGFNKSGKNNLLTIILVIHFVVGIGASLTDWVYPFTASKAVANFIRKENMLNYSIAGDWDFAASAVSFYIDKDIYYPRSNKFGSYVIWDTERRSKLSQDDIDIYAKINKLPGGKKSLLVMNYKLNKLQIPVKNIGEFTKSIVEDEKYYLYIIPK